MAPSAPLPASTRFVEQTVFAARSTPVMELWASARSLQNWNCGMCCDSDKAGSKCSARSCIRADAGLQLLRLEVYRSDVVVSR